MKERDRHVSSEESVGGLGSLEAFVARRGAVFYGLPANEETRVLVREQWTVPERFPFGNERLGMNSGAL